MLTKRIIPCLDVMGGRVVKGTNFINLKDAGGPVGAAKAYEEQMAEVFMPLTVGGGIRDLGDIRDILLAGADKVTINTTAVERPEIISDAAETFGSQCICVAIDAKARQGGFEVYTYGGRQPTGVDAVGWAQRVEALGAGEILLTSMDRDGTRVGYDIPLTRTISEAVTIPVIASGGVGTLEHLYEGLVDGKADAVLAASIFHYREHTVLDAKRYLHKRGVAVRL